MIGARKPRWVFTHLNRRDEAIKRLDGVQGGSLEISALSELGSSGSLTIVDLGQEVDLLNDRVRIEYDPGNGDLWAWGTMLMRSSNRKQYETHAVYEIELLSKLQVLIEHKTDYGFTIPAGKNIVEAIVELLAAAGETRVAVTESDAVLLNPLVYVENETYLTVLNELTTAANFWAVWADGNGQIRVEPYSDPRDRPVVYEFERGETAIHMPEWGREQDLASIPNVVKVRRAGTDDVPGGQGVAVNDAPNNRFSTVNRGEIVQTYDAEAGDLNTLNSLAERYLLANQAPVAKLDVTHAVLPLEQNQRIRFSDRGYDETATIRKMSVSFDEFTQVRAEWVEV